MKNNIEMYRLSKQIENLREKMHRAGSRPGKNDLQNSEIHQISRQLDQLILQAMKHRAQSGRPVQKVYHNPSGG